MMEHLFQQPWVMRIGWTLVHFLWQGTAVAFFAALALTLGGRHLTPSGRYSLLCACLGAMVAAPLITCATLGATGGGALPAPALRLVSSGWTRALPLLVWVWLAGVALFTARLIGAWKYASRMRATSAGPIPAEWQRVFDELIVRMQVSAPVRAVASSLTNTPVVIGWLRPVILMPVEVLVGAPLEHVRALLAHELAHIVRHDYVINILQSIAEAVLFYHPAVWWISGRIRTERECACDDIAVAVSGDVTVYVSSLAALEERRRLQLKTALAANDGSVVSRVRRLLDSSHEESHQLPGPATWVLSLVWLAAAGSAALQAAPATRMAPTATRMAEPIRVIPTAPATVPSPARPLEAPKRAATGVVHPVLTALLYDPFFDPPQQAPKAAPSEEKKKQARVEGTVVSAAGVPLKKAIVTLQLPRTGGPVPPGPTAFSEETDDAGRFAIDDLAPGDYTLSAKKVGFVAGTYGAKAPGGPGTPVKLDEGSTLTELQVQLTPQGVVSGKLTDEDGEPRRQSQVCLVNPEFARRETLDQMNIRQGHCSQANGIGGFAITEVPPGGYFLVAQPVGTSPFLEPGSKDVTTFYPNAADAAGAATVQVSAGMRLEGMNIRLRRERQLSRIKGRVVMAGAPAKGTLALLLTPAGGGQRRAGEDRFSNFRLIGARDGAFQISDVSPGIYILRSAPSGLIGGAATMGLNVGYSGSVDISVKDANVDNVVLTLEPGIEIEGSVKLEDGSVPAGRASVGFTPEGGSISGAPMLLQQDGTFHSMPVATGRYLLNVIGLPPGSYVKSVSYGAQDVTRLPLTVVSAAAKLDIVVSVKAATVSGSLRNEKGEPQQGIVVTAWPKNPNPGSADGGVRTASSDQSGAFRIAGLAPGEYYVAAWEEIGGAVAKDLDFLASFTSQAVTVDLKEGAGASADVKIVPKDKITAESDRLR